MSIVNKLWAFRLKYKNETVLSKKNEMPGPYDYTPNIKIRLMIRLTIMVIVAWHFVC
jgi:hypothetical protein